MTKDYSRQEMTVEDLNEAEELAKLEEELYKYKNNKSKGLSKCENCKNAIKNMNFDKVITNIHDSLLKVQAQLNYIKANAENDIASIVPMPTKMEVYLVTMDGYVDGDYGSEIFVIGAYPTKEEASKAAKEATTFKEEYITCTGKHVSSVSTRITRLVVGETFDIIRTNFFGYKTKEYLGGYIE